MSISENLRRGGIAVIQANHVKKLINAVKNWFPCISLHGQPENLLFGLLWPVGAASDPQVGSKGLHERHFVSSIFFIFSNKFNKPDEGKVFHIESRSLRISDTDLSQHNTV